MSGVLLMGKTGYRILAYFSLILAFAGILLPLLPTTPFVLLAAWCAGRGSPAFAAWLDNHQRFGPLLEGWRAQRAVPLSAKVLAPAMMALSWTLLFLAGMSPVVLVILGLFFAGLTGFLVTRPSC